MNEYTSPQKVWTQEHAHARAQIGNRRTAQDHTQQTAPRAGSNDKDFEVIPGDQESTVILHVPHSSTRIPADVRDRILLGDEALSSELAAITDAHTDVIAVGAAQNSRTRPWIFVNRTSRLVVDPERFPDEREELNAVGMGAVYEATTDCKVLREPSESERQDLLDRFFIPYADSIASLVRQRLAAVGEVTIIDVHSYPKAALPYERHGDGPRPEICIGTDTAHTPQWLTQAAIQTMQRAAPSADTGLNSPFAGCYVPLDQYGSNPQVRGVMLEIRRDVVASSIRKLQVATAKLVDVIDSRRESH